MRLPVRLVYNLAEGSPRRRGRPVSLPPSYHLITGFYHLEPFLRFGKHVRETASFQQKGPPLTEWPSIIVELRGLPQSVGIPPFSRCVGLSGTLLGTLRGFSRPARSGHRFGVCRRSDLPVHFLIALFYAGGGGTPALRRAFPERSGRQATQRSSGLARFSLLFTFFVKRV